MKVVDPVPLHVESVREHGIAAEEGGARELPEPDESWDAVLLFGPVYHLLDRADRVRAYAEARRVVRPGGVVLAATISRFASVYETLLNGMADRPEFVDAGLHLDNLYAVEGMAQWMPDIAERLSDPDGRALVLELIARTEREPSILGATAHVLVAAHR